MHRDVPAPVRSFECCDCGIALEKHLGQRVDRAPRGLFVGKRKAGAVGGRGGAHLVKIGLNCFDEFDELLARIFFKNCACLL